MAAGLTVRDLIGNASLGTRLVTGARGVDRDVHWAHSCELEDPARWLGPHELLMTIGHCVPSKAAEQRAFIARLDDAGIAGITIGCRATRTATARARPLPANAAPIYLGADDNLYGFALMHLVQVLAVDATSVYQKAAERLVSPELGPGLHHLRQPRWGRIEV
jgi:hypothetical protein